MENKICTLNLHTLKLTHINSIWMSLKNISDRVIEMLRIAHVEHEYKFVNST